MKQKEALEILKKGQNVFLTGSPGSGKTHTINEYVAYLRANSIEPAITASTGISATHIGGLTIHSWSGFGIKNSLNKKELAKIASTEYIKKRVRRAKVLIIDEISMLSASTFGMVEAVCREIKDKEKPFGGMQVVLVGDFFQLPPIVKTQEKQNGQATLLADLSGRFAYDSPMWHKAKLTTCYLTEQHRQDDADFLNVLSAIRKNNFNDTHISHLKARKITEDRAPGNVPKLFSHNMDVDRVNSQILGTLAGESKVFHMFSQGPASLVEALKRGCLSPEKLLLKIGAAVMFTKNNAKAGFVNGTLGMVEGFEKHTQEPIVKTRDGKRINVESMDWRIDEHGKARARISQLPLRLAWAITVHKSQGMSLDEAVMDLGRVFEFGQGYVALSRVRRLSGLHLLGWNENAFKVHPEVLAKDGEFQAQSAQAVAHLASVTEHDSKKVKKEFIIACGGAVIPENQDAPRGFDEIRETHPNAYLPWDDIQDERLKELFEERTSVAELAGIFNRTNGAITSRLKKLGILEG